MHGTIFILATKEEKNDNDFCRPEPEEMYRNGFDYWDNGKVDEDIKQFNKENKGIIRIGKNGKVLVKNPKMLEDAILKDFSDRIGKLSDAINKRDLKTAWMYKYVVKNVGEFSSYFFHANFGLLSVYEWFVYNYGNDEEMYVVDTIDYHR